MAKLPVWRGSPPLPQWRRNNGVLVPVWAEDPCDEDCDCDEEPPIEPPFEVDFCGCRVCGITFNISGYVSDTFTEFCGFNGFVPGPRQCQPGTFFTSDWNRTIECLAGNFNGSYQASEFTDMGGFYYGRILLGQQKPTCSKDRSNPGLLIYHAVNEEHHCESGTRVMTTRAEAWIYIWAIEFFVECQLCPGGKQFRYNWSTLDQRYLIYNQFGIGAPFFREGWGAEYSDAQNLPNGCSIPLDSNGCWSPGNPQTVFNGVGFSECVPDCPATGSAQADRQSCRNNATITHSLALEFCPDEPGQAPTVTLTEFPPPITSNPNATFAWTTTGVVETTEITLDEGLPEPGISPHDYTGLAVGVHTFKVRVSNQFGFDEEEYTWEVVFEPCEPPTIGLQVVPPSFTSETSATFQWLTTGTVRETRLVLDSGAPQIITGNSIVLHSLSVGPHSVSITVDSLQCGSATNGHGWVITGTPVQPPTVEITQGPPTTTTNTTATLGWVLGGGAPDTVTCQLDSGSPSNCGSPITYQNLSVGQHTFRVTASNAAGSAFDEHFWEVLPAPPQAPTVTITQAPTSPTSSTSATLNWTTTGQVDVTTCQIDGEPVQQCSGPRTYTDLLPGPHTFTVSVFNQFGSDSDSHSWTIVEDIPPPTVQLTLTPPAVSNSGSATFDWVAGGGPVATTTCRLDNGTPQNCSRPANYSNLTDGFHTFEVVVANSAGSDSDSYTWEVRRTRCQKLAQLLRVAGTIANVHIEVTFSGVQQSNCSGPGWNRTFLLGGPTALQLGSASCNSHVLFSDTVSGNFAGGAFVCNIATENWRIEVVFADQNPLSVDPSLGIIEVQVLYQLQSPNRGIGAAFRLLGAANFNAMIDQMLQTGQGNLPFVNQGSLPPADPQFNFANATCTVRVIPI